MGCRILTDGDKACYYDSVTGTAFGPVFDDGEEEAEAFITYLEQFPAERLVGHAQRQSSDPRAYGDNELTVHYGNFVRAWIPSFDRLDRVVDDL